MLGYVLISTVGISLLSNYSKEKGIKIDDITKEFQNDANKDKIIKDLIQFIKSVGDERASAETNSITKIIKIEGEPSIIYLLHSDTIEGELCVQVLSSYFSAHLNCKVKGIKIKDLRYDELKFMNEGLKNLIKQVAEIIKNSKPRKIVLNATPGFKPEVAYLTILGVISGCTIYYIHEKFHSLIKLPPLPIYIDAEFLKKNMSLLKELARGIDANSPEAQKIKSDLSLQFLVEEIVEDETKKLKLNPAGELVYLAPELRKI